MKVSSVTRRPPLQEWADSAVPAMVRANGKLELSDDGREVIEEALFLTSTAEARGLRGFRGSIS